MIQKFHTGIARRYGIAAALLAEAIWTEIKENEFHGRCQYDGETWMCCSRKMFLIRMPYLTKHMVSTGLARLKRAGVLIKGEWNKGQSDRTGWYTFTPYGRKVMEESEDEDYA